MKNMKKELHILRYFSSLVTISSGRVITVSNPTLRFCPLARHLYKGFREIKSNDQQTIKREIKKAIASKIKDYGFFTSRRKFIFPPRVISYGASEILKCALDKKLIKAAVVVCDGAGTVVTVRGNIVQGIGARMNSLVYTSPIKRTMEYLEKEGCLIVSPQAMIDQVAGIKKALTCGYKKIAVTVNGHDAHILKPIRRLEKAMNGQITILVVCTTGLNNAQEQDIKKYADLVWSCASKTIRSKVGPVAILQVSKQIPVFILTEKGLRLFQAFTEIKDFLSLLKQRRQYLLSPDPGGKEVKIGTKKVFLHQARLPVWPKLNY